MTDAEKDAIFQLRDILVPVLRKVYQAEGFNYAWNEGEVGGQSEPHFHFHLIPRKKGDTGITGYDPRTFLYRPTHWETISEERLQEITRLLRREYSGSQIT